MELSVCVILSTAHWFVPFFVVHSRQFITTVQCPLVDDIFSIARYFQASCFPCDSFAYTQWSWWITSASTKDQFPTSVHVCVTISRGYLPTHSTNQRNWTTLFLVQDACKTRDRKVPLLTGLFGISIFQCEQITDLKKENLCVPFFITYQETW